MQELIYQHSTNTLLENLNKNESIIYTTNGNRTLKPEKLLQKIETILPLIGITRIAEISNLMVDIHTQNFNYIESSPPLMATASTMFGTGQLPKFEEDQFEIKSDSNSDRKFLIPTAEVILTNMVREKILSFKELPIRLVASTACFRKEAGSYGKDTKGMIRQHQFYKVELVSIVEAKLCLEELDRMTGCAENILQKLELPYRKILLSTGDMGFSAEKTYDLEVWIPSENKYREISSCSSCGSFQARRMKARYKNKIMKQILLVH